jgi:hypothetical protein
MFSHETMYADRRKIYLAEVVSECTPRVGTSRQGPGHMAVGEG